MSKVKIDGVSFDVTPEAAGLFQAVSEERDELRKEMEKTDCTDHNHCGSNTWEQGGNMTTEQIFRK